MIYLISKFEDQQFDEFFDPEFAQNNEEELQLPNELPFEAKTNPLFLYDDEFDRYNRSNVVNRIL